MTDLHLVSTSNPETAPVCCNAPMVHNTFTEEYECADAYLRLVDEGFGEAILERLTADEVPAELAGVLEHWRESRVPDRAPVDTPAAVNPRSIRLTEAQAEAIEQADANGGRYYVSNPRQRVKAEALRGKGVLGLVAHTIHESVYELTDLGREVYATHPKVIRR